MLRRSILPLPLLACSFLAVFARDMPLDKAGLQDLTTLSVKEGRPAPGKRVKMVVERYEDTDIHHVLYLPTDWESGKRYPLIVEYAGNKYKTSLGTVEGSSLGYGISGGKGFIWVCMPYVSKDHQRNETTWWGDVDATVDYCKKVIASVCKEYGGDPNAVFIAGFSRGAIACNYIGLHDDEIARHWRGFICHDHYDGVRNWGYADSERASAGDRLKRLKGRPQFISGSARNVSDAREYLEGACPDGRFTFQPLRGWGHTDVWVLHDVPEREAVRRWIENVLDGPPLAR